MTCECRMHEEGRAGVIHRGDDLWDVISGFTVQMNPMAQRARPCPKWTWLILSEVRCTLCVCVSHICWLGAQTGFHKLMHAVCSSHQDEQMMQANWEQLFFIAITSDSISVTAINLCCCYCVRSVALTCLILLCQNIQKLSAKCPGPSLPSVFFPFEQVAWCHCVLCCTGCKGGVNVTHSGELGV